MTVFIIHPSELITDHRPHGDGTVAWGFIRELARRGHHVHVACERADLAAPPPPNVTLHPITTRKAWGIAYSVEYTLRVRWLFERLRRRVRFDVAHQLNPVFSGLSLALTGCGVPIVLGSYVADWPCGWDGRPIVPQRDAVLKRVVRYLQQRSAAALLVTTRAALNTRIAGARSIRARVRWQHHGIDSAWYAPRAEERTAALVSGRIAFLANVGVRKGIFTLVEAFERVHETWPHATLVIAGTGPCLDEVRERVRHAGLEHAVELLGNVARSEVAGVLHGCAVFCAPSFGEPYGMSAIEAMACGLPLVVTNDGGLAEVADPQGALFITPGDSAGLAEALLTVLRSPERARAMGDHNLRRAHEVFDWHTVVDQLEATYAAVACGTVAC